jgi:hypothetical protein
MRSRLLIPALAIGFTGAIASCDNSISSIAEGLDDVATWRATLTAAQETPTPTGATAGANGRAWFTDNGTTITWHLQYSGLTSNAIAAHIHRGAVGVSGPIVAGLTVIGQTSGVVEGYIDMTVADVAPGAETVSADSLRTLLNNGNAYVNVHTTTNTGGEIRGQIARR